MSDVSNVSGGATPHQVQNYYPQEGEYVGDGEMSYGGHTMSVMQAASLLYMERSEAFSGLASDRIEKSQDKLAKIKEARSYLEKMRTLKAGAKDDADYSKTTDMPQDMMKWMYDNNIGRSSYGFFHGTNQSQVGYKSSEWDVSIQNTSAHIEGLTDSNQLEFMKLKSTVNKLDEAISASNKLFDKNSDAIKAILK